MTKQNFSMVEYFKLLAENHQPRLRFRGNTQKEFQTWKTDLLQEINLLLGPKPQPVELNPEIVWETENDDLITRRVILHLEEHMSVAALLHIPKAALKKPAPAILCNHGHGQFGKDSVMGVRSIQNPAWNQAIDQYNYDYGLQMARRGFVTIAIDWRAFGERSDNPDRTLVSSETPYPGRDKCNVHFIRGTIMGINLLTLDIFDAGRTIDYLCSLDCVDSTRIGAMGLSFGGTMTTWISLLDPRIRAADIICYSCRFKNFAIADANFCGSQILPGLFALCDVPDLHGLIAPKPLLAEIGVHDKCFTVDDALSCATEVTKIYHAAGVPQNYEIDLFEGVHQFAGNKAFSFFDKHLKRSPASTST